MTKCYARRLTRSVFCWLLSFVTPTSDFSLTSVARASERSVFSASCLSVSCSCSVRSASCWLSWRSSAPLEASCRRASSSAVCRSPAAHSADESRLAELVSWVRSSTAERPAVSSSELCPTHTHTHTHRQTGRVRGEASDTAYQPGDSETLSKTHRQTGLCQRGGQRHRLPTRRLGALSKTHTHTDKQAVSEGRPATPPTNPQTRNPVQNTQTNRLCQRGGQRHRLPTRRLGTLSKTHTQTNRPCQRGGQRHRLLTRRL